MFMMFLENVALEGQAKNRTSSSKENQMMHSVSTTKNGSENGEEKYGSVPLITGATGTGSLWSSLNSGNGLRELGEGLQLRLEAQPGDIDDNAFTALVVRLVPFVPVQRVGVAVSEVGVVLVGLGDGRRRGLQEAEVVVHVHAEIEGWRSMQGHQLLPLREPLSACHHHGFSSSVSSLSKFWKTVKDLENKPSSSQLPTSLNVDDVVVTDKEHMAELFNHHFVNQCGKKDQTHPAYGKPANKSTSDSHPERPVLFRETSTVQRDQHSTQRDQHSTQRDQHSTQRDQHSTQRDQHCSERPALHPERPALFRETSTPPRETSTPPRETSTLFRETSTVQRDQHCSERPVLFRETSTVQRDQHSTQRDQHSTQRDQHFVQRDQHSTQRDQHFVQRDQHSTQRDQHFVQRDQHLVQRDQNSTQRDQHFVQRDQHSTQRDQHSTQRDQHSTQRDQHSTQRDQHSTQRDQHFVQRDQHSTQRDQHSTQRDQHSTQRDQHSTQRDQHSTQRDQHFVQRDQHLVQRDQHFVQRDQHPLTLLAPIKYSLAHTLTG
ncbi:unnamed protein product [Coregonus sp. 'balchen']|nr:unnamed protein product [Coregonus sp. 'balchen']